ncbi:MAG: UDP-4-amino-4,6-dideoxy-N-acetyl-beta-L-altrosamine transaminase [Deltaproteobacteria bacterium]|nr:UDP-4-amino-4,6-dideoxy-N-acetyl-beta-L-altrosamine transaminase [Deltaproteobacteria bacterium]
MKKIPYSRQHLDEEDIQAVCEVLRSDTLTQGPKVLEFEKALAKTCEAKYAVAFANGTAALHAACAALGVKEGDEGIVPPLSFAATANCLLYVGAQPLFTDVSAGLPQINVASIQKQISPKTKIIIPVHFAGSTAPVPEIHQLAKKENLLILEDACHALGASYWSENEKRYIKVGSCTHSHATAFSFHPVKNITTGEGGAVTTNDEELYQKLKSFRQHGIVLSDPEQQKPGWYYEMQDLGYNYRLTEIQAALGLSQLKKLEKFCNLREEKFEYYRTAFENFSPAELLIPPDGVKSAFHLAILKLRDAKKRDGLFSYLRGKQIFCQLHYIPIYRHPYYRQHAHFRPKDFPQSEDYFEKAISIPLYPYLKREEQDYVIECIHHFFNRTICE